MSGNWKDANNYYEILEVSPTASMHDIHEAYKRAKVTYSHDSPALYSMFTREEAQQLMGLVEEAYQVLISPRGREAYDQRLNGTVQQTPTPASDFKQQVPRQQSTIPEAEVVAYSAFEASQWQSKSFTPADEGAGVVRVKTSRPPSPDGMGQTKFSTYKIDSAIEEEMKTRTDFDGDFLRHIREYKQLSLEHMSSFTRVSRTYLSAVESMDLGALPAPVFVRGFVVQVARVLGLDEKRVADSYMKILRDKAPAAQ